MRDNLVGAENNARPWSANDTKILLTMYDTGENAYAIAGSLGRTYWSVQTRLRDLGVRGKRHEPAVRWKFTGMTKELAYIMGCYLSDGFFTGRTLAIQVADSDFAIRFARCVESMVQRKPSASISQPLRGRQLTAMKITCPDMGEWLENETQHKKVIPEWMWKESRECRLELAAGIMDGDGWISESKLRAHQQKNKYQVGFASSDGWATPFSKFLRTLGVLCKGPYVYGRNSHKPDNPRLLDGYTIDKQSLVLSDFYFGMQRKQERLSRMRQFYLPQRLYVSTPNGDMI